MNLSKRITNMQESPIRKFYPYALEAKRKGVEVYHLNIGQPDVETPKVFFDAIKSFSDKVLPYGPSDGLPELKEIICRYFDEDYGIKISCDETFVTTAGSEALLFVFFAIADYGDEIIVPEPFYTNYNGFAQLSGVKLVPITTKVEDGFHLTNFKEFENKISSKTKAILLCNPNNPTGTLYEKDEIKKVLDIAKRHDLWLIIDEVYREFVFDNRKPYTSLEFEDDRIIITDSVSKRFSACGARIGFVVTKNKEILRNILKAGQARLCPPTLEQIGAIYAYKERRAYLDKVVKEYEERRNVVFEELEKIEGVFAVKPEGAFYTVIKLPVEDAEDFVIFLLKDFNYNGKTVMLAPAKAFYVSPDKGKNEVRIAYVLEKEKLRDAMKILEKALDEYRPKR